MVRGGQDGERIPSLHSVLTDPATSFALKTVLVAWSRRDPVDAAIDGRILCEVLEREAEARLGGRHESDR